MSGANDSAPVSGANDSAPVSGANDSAPVSGANDSAPVSGANDPHITVLRGAPSAEELAALVTVLGTAGGGPVEDGPREHNPWGHPADKLRYPMFSWQRVTLLERLHMRR